MGHCYGSSQDLASLLVANGARRPRPPVSLGQLFRTARLDFPALYGSGGGGIPAGLRMDDERSVRCLEMAHRVLLIRFAIWKAKADPPTDDDEPGLRGHHPRYAFFMEELLGLQEVRAHSIPIACVCESHEIMLKPEDIELDISRCHTSVVGTR